MRASRVVVPAVIVLLIGALWVEGQTRNRRNLPRPGQPQSPVPGVSAPETMSEPTRIDVEFFQVNCAVNDLPKVNVEHLAKENDASETLLASLSKIGDASLQVHLSNTIDLSKSSSMTRGTRVPVVTSQVKSSEGKVTPSVTYEQVGAVLRVQGYWDQDRKPAAAHVMASIELSSVGKSSMELEQGQRLTEFGQFRVEQEMDLEHGKPVLLLANSQAAPVTSGSEKTESRCTITLVRVTAWKLWEEKTTEKE